MGNVLLVVVCLLLGVLARRSRRFPEATPAVLSRVVIDAALPALTLLYVPRLTVDGSAGLTTIFAALATPWLLFALALAVLWPLARARGWSRGTLGALVLTTGLANTAFVGFPLIEALYGARAAHRAGLRPGGLLPRRLDGGRRARHRVRRA